ncbi:transcriptional regulator FilR1 domain-containing protein [Haladaptatus sp. DFWS20]|uniref:transcriptional regulator FilR1 domain-containing protein n=1 Tax=Haladaptatus sp. DFWS20 TaxID=3403467 RepID=UPI003EC0E408
MSFIDAGTRIELIIDETVLDISRSIYKSAFADALNDDDFSLFVSPDDLSFGLAVFDDRALVGAYSESGQLQACLESRDDEFVKWATERYDEHRRRASAIEAILDGK